MCWGGVISSLDKIKVNRNPKYVVIAKKAVFREVAQIKGVMLHCICIEQTHTS